MRIWGLKVGKDNIQAAEKSSEQIFANKSFGFKKVIFGSRFLPHAGPP